MNKNSTNNFEIFPWSTNLETGIEIIDEQHKNLVRLLNKIAKTLTYNKNVDIDSAFSELLDYAKHHFKTEEGVWSKYLKDDVLFHLHQENHNDFLPAILKIKEENINKSDNESIESIVQFLIRWLTLHIIDEDLRITLTIKELEKGHSIKNAKENANKKMYRSKKLFTETILNMYEGVSSKNIELMKERNARIEAEESLKKANKELERLSITDPLTKLYNRRHFESIFSNEIQRAKRNKFSICLIIFDIDYFKFLNDTYGHVYGDEALISIGKALKSVCKRPFDFAFRIGGEEFAILTTIHHKSDNSKQFVNMVKQSIDNLKIEHKSSNVSKYLTISAGVLIKMPDHDDTIDSYVKVADEKLYFAKENGRNQVSY